MKSVINLLRTPQGFTLVEGDIEVNRSTGKPQKDKSYSAPKSIPHYIQNSLIKILPYILTSPVEIQITTNISLSLPEHNGSI